MTPDWWRALFIIAVLTHVAGNEAELACSCGGTGQGPALSGRLGRRCRVCRRAVPVVQQIDHETLGEPSSSVLIFQFEVEQGFVNAVPGPLRR